MGYYVSATSLWFPLSIKIDPEGVSSPIVGCDLHQRSITIQHHFCKMSEVLLCMNLQKEELSSIFTFTMLQSGHSRAWLGASASRCTATANVWHGAILSHHVPTSRITGVSRFIIRKQPLKGAPRKKWQGMMA
jgi:hypothetical protein